MKQIDLRRVDLNLLVVFEVLMSERGVTRAAERLGRTQSAVSHALGRLREQLDDPILVKTAGRMQPSPFALELVEQVRPILRNVQRVLSPTRAFDPATSTRTFRLAAPDVALALIPRLMELAWARAPGVALEWIGPKESMLLDIVEGQLDVAIAPVALRLQDGVSREEVAVLDWRCFGRRGHPAFARWGKKAWSDWPHVMVGVDHRVINPVSDAAATAGVTRRIAARVPNFSAVAPLLARSDLLATLPAIVMVDALQRFDLVAKAPPIAVKPMPHAVLWSTRLTNDPESVWIRTLLRSAIEQVAMPADAVAA